MNFSFKTLLELFWSAETDQWSLQLNPMQCIRIEMWYNTKSQVPFSSHLHSSSSASVGKYPETGLAGPDEGLWSLGFGFGLSPPVRVYSRYRSDLRNKG